MREKWIVREYDGPCTFGVRYDYNTHELFIGGPYRFISEMEEVLKCGVVWNREGSKINYLLRNVGHSEFHHIYVRMCKSNEVKKVRSFKRLIH